MSFDALLGHFDFGDDPEDAPPFAGQAAPTVSGGRDLGQPRALHCGPVPALPAHVQDALRAEAALQLGRAARVNTHTMAEGGPVAAEVQRSDALLAFLRDQVPDGVSFEPTTSYYHWYGEAADRVEPHRDQADFFLGCILLLKHTHAGTRTSRFTLHPPGGAPVEVPLKPGDAVVFFSGAVTHGRSRPAPGERVNTLTFGFRLLPCEQ